MSIILQVRLKKKRTILQSGAESFNRRKSYQNPHKIQERGRTYLPRGSCGFVLFEQKNGTEFTALQDQFYHILKQLSIVSTKKFTFFTIIQFLNV